MKDKIKTILTLICLLIPLVITSIAINDSPAEKKELSSNNKSNKEFIQDPNKIKDSSSWIADFIHINNDNWSAIDLPWIQNKTGTWDDPHIIENVTINGLNKTSCIYIENCNNYFEIRNCTVFNSSESGAGIKLVNVQNGKVINNTCSTNYYGINLVNSSNLFMSENNILNNSLDGLFIDDCNHSLIINNFIYNNTRGVRMWGHNISVFENQIIKSRGHGMLCLGYEFKICKNKFIKNSYAMEISISDSELTNNTFLQNDYGLFSVCGSLNDFNNISYNTYLNNSYAISLTCLSYSTLSHNLLANNSDYGISLFAIGLPAWAYNNNNSIVENQILNNNGPGIELIGYLGVLNIKEVKNINITENVIKNNDYGIILKNADDNIIRQNLIEKNKYIGLNVSSEGLSADNNLICDNAFLENGQNHAQDYGISNQWDNGFIGNYWDNYTDKGGTDTNNDGIGDIPYPIIGTGIDDDKPLFNIPFHQGEKIHLDDSGVNALNWSQTALVKWWCKGDGKEETPYLIEDLVINGSSSGSCIHIENSNIFSKIENCTVYNSGDSISNDGGIVLFNTNNSIILNCNISFNQANGLILHDGSNNNRIINNTINNNKNYGIVISKNFFEESCNNNNITENSITNNKNYGIWIFYSDYNNVTNNYIYNNTNHGINLCSNSTFFSGNTVYNNTVSLEGWNNKFYGNYFIGQGIEISNDASKAEMASFIISTTNMVNGKTLYYYKNEIGLTYSDFLDAGQIILINCNNSMISENTLYNNSNINLKYSNYNLISNVSFSLNSKLDVYKSDNNTIINCIFNCSSVGIFMQLSNYNNISGNTFKYNSYGMRIFDSNYTTISKNIINNNTCGIRFIPWDIPSRYNNITQNVLENNKYGMFIQADGSLITNNVLINNEIGINLGLGANQIYLNFFRKNKISAVDSFSNKWNSSSIGNYWDNYTGVDNIAPFGIGDTAHTFDGVTDNLPIFDRYAPYIEIRSPENNAKVNRTAPSFEVYIYENYTYGMWYTIDGGLTNFTFTENGSIDQTLWEGLWDSLNIGDNITISFYAEDKPGYISTIEINVTKFITQPVPQPPTPTGDDDDDDGNGGTEEFDIVKFITSPIGLAIIGGSIGGVAIITIVKIKGASKNRLKEIERIKKIKSE